MYGKWFLGCCTAALITLSGAVQAGTLDRLRQDHNIRIAYRRDAPPFSYQNGDDKPTGFIVDLCQVVAKRLSQQVDVPALSVSYVPVTAADRFDAISQGKADLLCEATTVTMSRRKLIDFSVDTFVDGAGLIIAADGPKDLRAMEGRAVGVLAGTTTEQALRTTLSGATGGSCLCQWRVDARPRAHYGRREERPRFLLRATADSSAGFRAAERRADPRHPRPYAPRRLRRQGGEGRTAHQHR